MTRSTSASGCPQRLCPASVLVFSNTGGHVELCIGDDRGIDVSHTAMLVHLERRRAKEQVVAYIYLTDV